MSSGAPLLGCVNKSVFLHGGKLQLPGEAAKDKGIYGVIQLLEQIAQHQRRSWLPASGGWRWAL